MTLPRTPSFRLEGKRALVAGATSGIGLGCAVALAEHGAEVTLAARSADKLAEIAAQMIAQGWQAETLRLDVAEIEATEAAVSAAGPFEILVKSGGLARHAPATEKNGGD